MRQNKVKDSLHQLSLDQQLSILTGMLFSNCCVTSFTQTRGHVDMSCLTGFECSEWECILAGSSSLGSNARLQLPQLLFKKDPYPGLRLLADFSFSRVTAQRPLSSCALAGLGSHLVPLVPHTWTLHEYLAAWLEAKEHVSETQLWSSGSSQLPYSSRNAGHCLLISTW